MSSDLPLSCATLPLIGVNACSQRLPEKHPFFIVGEKYVRAVSEGAGGMPLVIPALGDQIPLPQLVAQLDGLLLTGSPSNIEPIITMESPVRLILSMIPAVMPRPCHWSVQPLRPVFRFWVFAGDFRK